MKLIKFIVGLFFVVAILFISDIGVSAEEMAIECNGSFKSFMAVTDLSTSSPQYNYLVENTYDENNLRITEDGFYAVAMGSYYGVLGDKFVITFSGGATVKVVKVDEKSNSDTVGGKGMCMISDGSIIEPILTTTSVSNSSAPNLTQEVWKWGNVGMAYSQFAENQSIVNINKVTENSRSEKPTHSDIQTSAARAISEREGDLSQITEQEEEMILFLPNVKHNKIVFLDTEFMEGRKLVQAAFIIFDRIDESDNFFLTNSLNLYVNTKVSPAFETFTGIKAGFLGNNGLTSSEAHELLDSFVEENEINKANTLLVGHGIKQDLDVLTEFGCPLTADVYDTHAMGRALLKRECKLKLSDLLLDAGLVQETSHDAYQDTRNLIPVYSYLIWVDFNRKKEREV